MVRRGRLAAAAAIVGPLLLLGVLAGTDWLTEGQPLFDSTIKIPPGGEVRQSVAVPSAGLDRMDVALIRYRPVTGTIVLSLTADAEGRQVLARSEIAASEIEDVSNPVRRTLAYTPFRFSALGAVAGEQIWLRLESHADWTVHARALQSTATINGAPRAGAPAGGRLTLRLHYRRSMIDNLTILANRLTRERPGLLGSPWFYVATLGVYSALAASVVWLLSCQCTFGGNESGHASGRL